MALMNINCPSCASQLLLPDELAGKRVQCPRCQNAFNATGGAGPPAQPPRPPRPAPRDDDDDDDDYRPRRRRRLRYDDDDHPDDYAPARRRPGRDGLEQGNGFAVTAMVLGIVSLCGMCLCPLVGIACGVLAAIFGILGYNTEGRGMAIAGIAMGGVGVLLGIASLLVFIGPAMLRH